MAGPLVWNLEMVAEYLGISRGRVSQIIDRLPPKVPIPGKSSYWWPASIRAYKAKRDENRSLFIHDITEPSEPMDLIVDAVCNITEWAKTSGKQLRGYSLYAGIEREPIEVHVRIYANDDYKLVLLAQLGTRETSTLLRSQAEFIAQAVYDTYLPGTQLGTTLWVLATEGLHSYSDKEAMGYETELQCMVFQKNDHQSYDLDLDRAESMFFEAETLDNLSGGTSITWYPWKHYTRETVEAFQRSKGKPVVVEQDDLGYKPLVAALRALDGESERLGHCSSFDEARRFLLMHLYLKHSGVFHVIPGFEHSESDRPVVVERAFELPADLVPRLVPHMPWVEEATWEEVTASYAGVRRLREQYDEYSDHPISEISESLDAALMSIRSIMPFIAPDKAFRFTGEDANEVRPRSFSLLRNGGWDQKYLSSLKPVSSSDSAGEECSLRIRRSMRKLQHAATGECRVDVEVRDFMVDPRGVLVRVGREFERDGQGVVFVTVDWPQLWIGPEVTSGMRICADGEVGDRPAYVAHSDVIVGLVPQEKSFNQWNFGYGGGGPGAFARSLEIFLEDRGFEVPEGLLDRITSSGSEDVFDFPLSLLSKKG